MNWRSDEFWQKVWTPVISAAIIGVGQVSYVLVTNFYSVPSDVAELKQAVKKLNNTDKRLEKLCGERQ